MHFNIANFQSDSEPGTAQKTSLCVWARPVQEVEEGGEGRGGAPFMSHSLTRAANWAVEKDAPHTSALVQPTRYHFSHLVGRSTELFKFLSGHEADTCFAHEEETDLILMAKYVEHLGRYGACHVSLIAVTCPLCCGSGRDPQGSRGRNHQNFESHELSSCLTARHSTRRCRFQLHLCPG